VDWQGDPYILDFGLATVTSDSSTGVSRREEVTTTGQFIGSLPWASPEQARGDLEKTDIRTDVYSLGVVLYQMLTSRFPYDVSGGVRSTLEQIIDAVPTRPSLLAPHIKDEVETIVLKCLNKEPERRYQSAGELARDIRRYLADEPIEAKRDSGWYVLRKILRRHRAATTAGAAFLVLIVAATVMLLFMYGSVAAERDRAVAAEHKLTQQLDKTEAARRDAETVMDFLTDMVSAVEPTRMGKDVAFQTVLDAASRTVHERFVEQPLLEARLLATLGWNYLQLGAYQPAEEHLAGAAAIYQGHLGENDRRSLAAINDLASIFRMRGEYGRSEAFHLAAIEIQRRVLGDEHPETWISTNNLANTFVDQGRYADAEHLHRRTLEARLRVLGEDDVRTVRSMNNLATALDRQGRNGEAAELYRRAVHLQRRMLGEQHSDTLSTQNNLAVVLVHQGRFAEAEELHRSTVEAQRRILGDNHPDTLRSINNLADAVFSQGRYTEALKLRQTALAVRRTVLGDEHPETLMVMHDLTNSLLWHGAYADAEELCRKTLEGRRRVLGEDHPHTLASMRQLTKLLARQGQSAEYERLCRDAIPLHESRAGRVNAAASDHRAFAEAVVDCETVSHEHLPAALAAASNAVEMTQRQGFLLLETQARALRLAGGVSRAVETLREGLRLLPVEGTAVRAEFESELGECLLEQDQFQEAEQVLTASYAWMQENAPDGVDVIETTRRRLAALYDRWNMADPGGNHAPKSTAYGDFPVSGR
jgi:tetratricopeptide (TPR) repeat protein